MTAFLGAVAVLGGLGAVVVFGVWLLYLAGLVDTGFLQLGEGLVLELFVLEVVAVQFAQALVLVDFGCGLELSGAEVAAVLLGVSVGEDNRLRRRGFARSGRV